MEVFMERNMNRVVWKAIVVLSVPMQSGGKAPGLDLKTYEFDAEVDGEKKKLFLPSAKLLPQIQKGKNFMAEIDPNECVLSIQNST